MNNKTKDNEHGSDIYNTQPLFLFWNLEYWDLEF